MTNENDPERKTQMKKITSIILAIIMTFAVLALAACNNTGNGDSTTTATPAGTTAPEAPKTDATTSAEKPAIESAAAFYTKVWGALTDDQKFPASGGDIDHTADGPAKFNFTTENVETFKWWLHVTDELLAQIDQNDVATLMHMMNTNTFCSAMAKLTDSSKAAEFAEAYKTAIQDQRWMCGFPDTVIVISVGDYVIMAYGKADIIENVKTACLAADSSAKLLIEAPALPA